MSEKTSDKQQGKQINLAVIIIAIVVIVIAGFVIYKVVGADNSWKQATKVEDIVIKDSDSDSVKVEKMQAKIELLNKDINKIQEDLNVELEKMNGLYEEYVSTMNEYQSGVPVTE